MNVAIVGAGVSGLTSAAVALGRGHDVTVFARDLSPANTSDVAAAFWYPYRAGPRDRVAAWGAVTYRRLAQLAGDPRTGVVARPIVHRYDGPAPSPWWSGPVDGFGPLAEGDRFGPWVDGFRYRTYLADTSRYMPWLSRLVKAGGGRTVRADVQAFDEIPDHFDAVVDATGVAARRLAGDENVFPIRGQVVRAVKPRGFRDEIRESHCCYVVPRHDDLILGGTADDHDWSRASRAEDTATILARCALLCRELDVDTLEVIETKVGLRPGRGAVRVEAERHRGRPVVHNYGHAGAGFTLSWGCAEEAIALVERGGGVPGGVSAGSLEATR